MDSDLEYCRALTARRDEGFYLISLILPRRERSRLWALGALRVTLRDIKLTVSEPTLGYIRLQWWREQLDAIIAGRNFAAEPILREISRLRILPQAALQFLSDYEALLEEIKTDDQAFEALIEAVLPVETFSIYTNLSCYLEEIQIKSRGSRWEGRPPFLAFRLWLKSVMS